MEVDMSELDITTLLEQAEDEGCVSLSTFNELVASFDMEEDAVDALMQMLHECAVVVRDDCGRDSVPATYARDAVAAATPHALQLFLNEAGRYTLLPAAEEVELAKRVERGDLAAQERMINSNL